LIRLLAIDSATDALSIALQDASGRSALHRVMPRQHQQQLFRLLDELLDGRRLAELSLDAIVYGKGPGSFTGLRIAVSAAQGLAHSLGLPVIGISSLDTQVRSLIRQQNLREPAIFFSSIDARIGQVYARWLRFDGSGLEPLGSAFVAAPEDIEPIDSAVAAGLPVIGVGSGMRLRETMPEVLRNAAQSWAEVLPEAEDMLEYAAMLFAAGQVEDPTQAAPDYVQRRIGWKTLAEQGRRA
jgi:tRNA threonylcarbamoyladenosine biosynthesis protein TsaB